MFLEGESASSIHRILVSNYLKASLDVNTVRRWVNGVNCNPREKKRKIDFSGRPCRGKPAAGINEDKTNEV